LNIIVLVCDTLRASNLACYGYDKNTSPGIDKIAEQGMRFSNTFSAINATDPSFTTLFTGKHPLSHGVIHHGDRVTEVEKSYAANSIFLPEVLREHGFVTIGVDWLGKWHKRGFDYYGRIKKPAVENEKIDAAGDSQKRAPADKGLHLKSLPATLKKCFLESFLSFSEHNVYYSLPSSVRDRIRQFLVFYYEEIQKGLPPLKKSPMLSDSAAFSDLAIRYIREFAGKRDFFLFVHYWDNHIPYTAPRTVVDRFLRDYRYPDEPVASILKSLSGTKAERLFHRSTRGKTPRTAGEIIAHYDASINYVDSNISRIYECLEETRILDDTFVIVTSDHGESLTEHDIFFLHHGLYDSVIRIPLIMSGPGIPSGRVCDALVQNFDLMPTICDMAGIKDVGGSFDGDSLLKLARNESWDRHFVYAEEVNAQRKRMIRDKNYKYIKALNDEQCIYCQKYHSKGDEFYDLQSDPEEKENIVSNPKHREYKDELEKYIDALDKPKEGKEAAFGDEQEINKRLQALGYI